MNEVFNVSYKDIWNTCENYDLYLFPIIEYANLLLKDIEALLQTDSIKGKSAEAIKNYFVETHGAMLSSIMLTAQSLYNNMIVYTVGYSDIDASTNFLIDENYIDLYKQNIITDNLKTLDAQVKIINKRLASAQNVVDLFSDDESVKLSDLSDSQDDLYLEHLNIKRKINNLKDNIPSYEETFRKEIENNIDFSFANMRAVCQAIGIDAAGLETYEPGTAILEIPEITNLYIVNSALGLQQSEYADAVNAANEIYAKRKAAVEEKTGSGIVRVVSGVVGIGTIIGGLATTPVTGGTSLIVAYYGLNSIALAFATVDTAEALQDAVNGSNGDIDTVSYNSIKEMINNLGGDDNVYDTINIVVSTTSGITNSVVSLSNAGNVTVGNVTQAIALNVSATAATEGAGYVTHELTGNEVYSEFVKLIVSYAGGKVVDYQIDNINSKGQKSGTKTSEIPDGTSKVQHTQEKVSTHKKSSHKNKKNNNRKKTPKANSQKPKRK